MDSGRRRLLILAAVPALALAGARLGDLIGLGRAAERAAEAAIRPRGSASSAVVCAACGSGLHAMLSPDCPASPHVKPGARA